jgi:hypothetical protein
MDGRQTSQPTPPAQDVAPKPSFGQRLKRSLFFRTRRRTILTILICTPLLLCMVYWLLGRVAFADSATVIELKGIVQVKGEEEPRWIPAQLNQFLLGRHLIRTGVSSYVRLLFFDASTVDLHDNTEISVVKVAKRRGGNAVDIVLRMVVGKTGVRAVRFVDPSSTLRMDTPTASTVVRGARFTVEVEEDGTTQIDLEEGEARVEVAGEEVDLEMGQRMTLASDGVYTVEQVFEPDAQPLLDKVDAAWTAPGETMTLELTESEVNRFLAAMAKQPDFVLRDSQVWFLEDEMRIGTTVVGPASLDLSAALGVEVVEGRLKPEMESLAAGFTLPVPAPVLDLAADTVFGQLEKLLFASYDLVSFQDVDIRNGALVVTGRKLE